MAFQSNGPVMLALPAFRGVTRRIVLAGIAMFVLVAVADALSPAPPAGTMGLILSPALVMRGWVWQLGTYAFLAGGLINTLLALVSVWFFGSSLEEARGGRWLAEYFGVSAVGGGVLACSLGYALHAARLPGMGSYSSVYGLWPMSLALLLAFARMNPEAEIRLYFVLRVKAKHMAAGFVMIYLAMALLSRDRFSALTALCVALCGYLFLRFVPRRGLAFSASESWYGLRNSYYRAKRRRAAKQFTVYMRKQGKDVSPDVSERYLDSRDPKSSRNPEDKRWMN